MKRMLHVVAGLLLGTALSAQFHLVPVTSAHENPRDLNRDAEFSINMLGNGWTQHLDETSGDQWSVPIALPFPVVFNGTTYTNFRADQAGILTFTPNPVTLPTENNSALPASLVPPASVCVWGLYFSYGGSGLYTKTFGTAPYRQFWAHWCFTSSDGVAYTYWSIVFEETTGHFYLVDQKTGLGTTTLTLGVQVSSTEAYQLPTSPNVANLSTGGNGATEFEDNVYYVVKPGAPQQLDAFTEQEATPGYAQVGTPAPVRAEVRNLGTQPLTSVQMHYRVDGGPLQSATANIAPPISTGEVAVLEHPVPWTYTADGVHTIDLWSNAPNGATDQWPANDTIHFTVAVEDTFVARTTLLEMFTSSTCGPCVGANAKLDTVVLPQLDNYCLVKYQQDFPGVGDPYYIPTAGTRAGYYGVGGIPELFIDAQEEGTQFLVPPVVHAYQEVPAFMSMQVTNPTYSGSQVSATVELNVVKDLPQNDMRLQVAVVEKLTNGNASTNGETEFHHVMMTMLPSANGQPLGALSAGQTLSFPVNANMASTFVEQMGDLAIVAWVEGTSPKRILQSACGDVSAQAAVGDLSRAKDQPVVFPVPFWEVMNVTLPSGMDAGSTRLTLVDAQGREVWSAKATGMRASYPVRVAEGAYYLRLTDRSGTAVVRVLVLH